MTKRGFKGTFHFRTGGTAAPLLSSIYTVSLHWPPKGHSAEQSMATADLCDANLELWNKGDIRILSPVFQIYGRKRIFSGPVLTMKIRDESNIGLRATLEEKGKGRVLVIEAGGCMNRAVIGGILSDLATRNGWAGIVIDGCIRDVDDINACEIGVRALASHPGKPAKTTKAEAHVMVTISGVEIHDGERLYADADGIVVSKTQIFSL